MKVRFLFGLFVTLSGILSAPILAKAITPAVPANNRLSEKPAWEKDVTDGLTLASGKVYEAVMSREARAGRVRGERLSWVLQVTLPPEAEADWPVVLEADESRVLENTRVSGAELSWDTRDTGDLWFSGEGSVVLPLTTANPTATVTFESLDNPQAYENGFGRLRLRPATLNEVIRLEWLDYTGQPPRVRNRGPLPINLELHTRQEDYFGASLSQEHNPLTLKPGESRTLVLRASDPEHYKTRFWATVGARTTFDHWIVRDGLRIMRQRPHALRLDGGWESVFAPGPFAENPPPTSGWVKGSAADNLPYSSHWRWYRMRFKVPADWPADQPVRLLLPPKVFYHARVVVNGKLIGESPGWELPKGFALPAEVVPGTEHELHVGVTDYIVGLPERVKPPAAGPMQPVGRGMIAPISTTNALGMEFDSAPELYSAPALRVENTVVRTTFADGKRIAVRVGVVNDRPSVATIGARFTVLAAGQPVLSWTAAATEVRTGSSAEPQSIESSAAWPDAIPWSLENPQLYELRVELTDAGNRIVDTFRERFGFREIGTRGEYFTLNGEIIKLHGGSHVYTTSLTWPVRPSPYRFIRAMANVPGPVSDGQAQGVVSMNAADEAGYLLKGALMHSNAHGADNYDWQDPVTWARFRAASEAVIRAYINHPSIFMWDIANEISFHGKGEDAMMGAFQRGLREFDPTRLVTVGGSYPFPAPSEVLNFHGWGSWQNRSDYFFMHPEERPSYLRDAGYFIRKPTAEKSDNWKLDVHTVGNSRRLHPGVSKELTHLGGKPVLFAEGMYFEQVENFPISGHDTYLRLSLPAKPQPWDFEGPVRRLNIFAARSRAIQNVRQAGLASSMIHVDGGTGRYLLPVASFPWDRDLRGESGSRLRTRFGLHYDLTEADTVAARYRLYDGENLLGEKAVTLAMKPGTIERVELDFALPVVTASRTLRVETRVWPEKGGEFFDSASVTVFAPARPALPLGVKLAVFDPRGAVAPFLANAGVPFTPLARPGDWARASDAVLLVGSEGLTGLPPEDLATLGRIVASGGRAIILNHFALPKFLPRNFVQSSESLGYSARLDGPSPVTDGLLTEDFRSWITRERDQVVAWNALETPATGHFLAHLNAGRAAPVLEVGEGRGRVLFVQLNLGAALGVEPVATRVLANLLAWTGSPSPFRDDATLIVASDKKFARSLESRIGLVGSVTEKPTATEITKAAVVLVQGTDAQARDALSAVAGPLRERLQAGATLLVYGLDEPGAEWLGRLTDSPVTLASFPHRYAYLIDPQDPLATGLGHGDFFVNGVTKDLVPSVPLASADDATGAVIVSGPSVRPLTRPAYLATIPVGRGRVLLNFVRTLEKPVPSQVRVLSMLLGNAGAKLDPDGVGQAAKIVWEFQPLDLSRLVNWSLRDTNDPAGKRGGNMSGEGDDFREFPVGAQTLRGVDYLITPPTAAGNSVVLVAGKNNKLGGATEVKGVPVNAKAERLFFLHTSLWGTPGFLYRVYYKEDRAKWIPGQPDPFVDVVVKADENISEWVFAGEFDRQTRFISGATIAWVGGNARTRGMVDGDKALGLYQMTWDNPHPEKVIESIDILSPQTDGAGNALVFGITAAVRDTSAPETTAPARPAPALSSVLPEDASPADVFAQVDFPRYGFVILKDGSLPAIYDSGGRAFAGGARFTVRSELSDPGDKPSSRTLTRQSGQTPIITETRTAAQRVFNVVAEDAVLAWTATITATPARLRYDFTYTPKVAAAPGWTARLTSGLRFTSPAQASVKVNENPIPVELPEGLAQFTFDPGYTRWVYDYEVWGGNFVIKSPRKDYPPFAPDRKETFWWELSPP